MGRGNAISRIAALFVADASGFTRQVDKALGSTDKKFTRFSKDFAVAASAATAATVSLSFTNIHKSYTMEQITIMLGL